MIRRETPEVITGARGPREQRESVAADKRAKRALGVQQVTAPGKIRFQSAFANLRIQVTAPVDVRDPFTGRVTPGRPKAAQFRDHILDVDASNEDLLGWLKGHPAYGQKFWLMADVIAEAKRQEVQQAKRILADPAQRAAVLEALKESGISDFTLPPVEVNE